MRSGCVAVRRMLPWHYHCHHSFDWLPLPLPRPSPPLPKASALMRGHAGVPHPSPQRPAAKTPPSLLLATVALYSYDGSAGNHCHSPIQPRF